MKRQHIVLFLIAALVLILMLVQKRPAADLRSESGKDVVQVPEPVEPAPEASGAGTMPSESSSPAVPPSPTETPAKAPKPVPEKIQENFRAARQAFQQKDAIARAKPSEVHRMPQPTLEAAQRLGEIAELETQHPEQAESFGNFYLECARDERTITVIRAQCLDKYVKGARLDSTSQKQLVQGFPDEIVRLYEALQD
ncbi:MAG TPA: hypothetical protein VE954_11795 [Oligoflexus sp.]|uniref:hypothetical protein n=1 Tax=Oligoflexus sp. TaxID=1971216 RepID=UPI002D30FDDF|nr:hypothetical protein [Oligoflexus sp.]HYX33788.1 hypothetical protein [Oligoflexus sp.]